MCHGYAMRVTRLSTTPIKGLSLHHPQSVRVDETGAAGDRLFYLANARPSLVSVSETGALVGITADYDAASRRLVLREGDTVLADDQVRLGDGLDADFFAFRTAPGRIVEGPFSEILSARAGRPLMLVQATDSLRGHDVEPLTLVGTGSIDQLSHVAGVPVDARRFRMLIEFDGGLPHVEDTWLGRGIRIGDATLVGGDPVQRCAGTTRHPDTGVVDLKTLTLIGKYRGRQKSVFGAGFNFGVYARCVEPGEIRVGDDVIVIG
ncbi:MAG: MOSC domain-containing protein [Actinobacteria bacterium]|nr:MOSC domain-containing protein [Actinomycetota bacterium]